MLRPKHLLALEFAYRALAQRSRRHIFWVPAISRDSLELAYRDIGLRLRVAGITDDNADVKKLVKEALSSSGGHEWVMIVDNADDGRVLMESLGTSTGLARLLNYLPRSDRGKIIFMTRSRKVAFDLTPSKVLELGDMSKAEARELLTVQTLRPELREEAEAVDKLLGLLTHLPLAIVQAAAFINSNDVSVAEYITFFQQAGTEIELLGEQFEDNSRYSEMDSTIARTWHISFDQMRKQDALAAEYLAYMSCLDRINIPRSLLLLP